MKKKTVLEAMKTDLIESLEGLSLELLGISTGTSVNKETGETTNFVKCEAEVPKGVGKLSRCRFSVKIPDGQIKVQDEQLSESDHSVTFTNLSVSYIDTSGNVYFKAEDYTVTKEGK